MKCDQWACYLHVHVHVHVYRDFQEVQLIHFFKILIGRKPDILGDVLCQALIGYGPKWADVLFFK